jgi:urease alpha subunit
MAQFSQRGVLWVVVLGDFGRSPRMQYHCLSLIRKYDVNIHVFAQSNNLQGVIPELLDARNSGQLKLWKVMSM